MVDPKALALFQEILKRTLAGKLAWEPTAEQDKFVAPMLGKYTLTLLPYTSMNNWGDPQGYPSLKLEDQNSNLIAAMDTSVDEIKGNDLETLLVFARRIALRADEKIDELLQALQKDEDNPF